ncbi:hypothetical protein BU116_10330, partial [Staphylococcus xylosus]
FNNDKISIAKMIFHSYNISINRALIRFIPLIILSSPITVKINNLKLITLNIQSNSSTLASNLANILIKT